MAPRAFPTDERKRIVQSLRSTASHLMRRHRLRDITVDDLAAGASIAKGSFYSFYRSREGLLWAAIKDEELTLVDQITQAASGAQSLETKLEYVFRHLLLGSDSLVFRLSTDDIVALTRKLPAELLAKDATHGHDLLSGLLSAFELPVDDRTRELVQGMVHTLRFVASREEQERPEVTDELLSLVVNAFTARLVQIGES